MNTGSVGINFFASNHAAPFDGRNDSGLGVEYGPEGLRAYTSYKSIKSRAIHYDQCQLDLDIQCASPL